MNLEALKTELAKPEYAELSDQAAADAINAPSITVAAPGTYLTELGVLDILGTEAGEMFLAALEITQNAMPVLKRAVRRLQGELGIDVGNATVRGQLQALAAAQVITPESVAALLAHGSKQISIAESNGWGVVGDGTVRSARESM